MAFDLFFGALGQQQLGRVRLPSRGGCMQGRPTIFVLGMDIGAPSQQEFDRLGLPYSGGCM